MMFVKKYFVWIVLALILVAEGAGTFVLLGRKGEAADQVDELKRKQKELADLRVWDKHADDLRRRFKTVRAKLTRQRDDCVLRFWRLDRRLEVMFDDQRLQDFTVRPWMLPRGPGFDRFAYRYQTVYNERADALVEEAEKLYIDRRGLGLASNTAFTQSHITIGDIYGAQKEFWLIDAIVKAAVEAEVSELDPIEIARGGKKPSRRGRGRRGTEAEAEQKPKLHRAITVDVVARAPYPRIASFIYQLHVAELPFRMSELLDTKRSLSQGHLSTVARSRGRGRGRPVAPEGYEPEGGMGPAPTAPEAPPMGPEMPREAMAGAGERPMEAGEAPPDTRPEPRTPPGEEEPAEPEKLVEAHLTCDVIDFTLDIAEARVTVPRVKDKADLQQWLQARLDARSSGYYQPLWRALLKGLETAEDVTPEGETLRFKPRPEEHFAPTENYDVHLERGNATFDLQFRQLVFQPQESEQGVEPATPSR
ncbi:MAG: hypothetical protein ACOC8D_00945 [bacterium]